MATAILLAAHAAATARTADGIPIISAISAYVAVLPAEKDQFWVYVLPAPTKAGVWPLGGDVRYRISPDGAKVAWVEAIRDPAGRPSQRGALFVVDLAGGDWETRLESVRTLLARVPGDTIVHPGHGPATTLERELQTNPFLRDLRAESS